MSNEHYAYTAITAHLAEAKAASETGWTSEELRHLREIIGNAEDAIIGAVAAMRAQGDSWTRIGDSLGMSKQAAQQRFGRPID